LDWTFLRLGDGALPTSILFIGISVKNGTDHKFWHLKLHTIYYLLLNSGSSGLTLSDSRCLDVLLDLVLGVILAGRV
jgi:hypothetical protein